MTEENKFKVLGTTTIYNDNIGSVSLYDASHANESEEQRIHTVTTIASLAYGNELAKNPLELYKRMQSIKHESLWEFIRDGYGTHTIASSMRAQPLQYEDNYSFDSEVHKANIACFKIKVPIFIARQFMRHRSFSYLEMSRRYTKGSKQPFGFWFPESFNKTSKEDMEHSYNETYANLISQGINTQIASRFLPQTTYTEFYCMTDPEGLKNFFKLRCDSHAQEQIRELSFAMLNLIKEHQPILYTKVKPDNI